MFNLGTSRASKDLLMKVKLHDLSGAAKPLQNREYRTKQASTPSNVILSKPKSQVEQMRQTMTGVRRGGYKGSNFVK